MKLSPGRLAAVLALALAALPLSMLAAQAQARIEDCESIQAADAYNQCLAKFGPTSKVKSLEPEKPGDVKDSSAEAAAGAASGSGSAHNAAHGRRGRGHAAPHRRSAGKPAAGRKRMTFTIKKRR